MRREKGITLIALMITIIVLLIILGISIGAKDAIKGEINNSKDDAIKSQLAGIQQAVLENYVKYRQTGNESSLVGEELSWSEANTYLSDISTESSTELSLKEINYDQLTDVDAQKKYYELDSTELKNLGLEEDEDTYIVNYETGEVFNITKKVTNHNEALYIYVVDKSTE